MAGISGGGMVSLVSIIITGIPCPSFTPLGVALLTCRVDIAPPEDVAVLRGYANVINASARSLGAPLGGLLIDSIGWRWSFFGHIPLVAFCILITTYGIPDDSKAKESHFEPDSERTDAPGSNASKFDFGGLASFFIAMVLFFAMLQDLGSANHSWRLAILMPATVVAILTFIAIEAYWAKKPLISLALFRTSVGSYLMNQTMMTACHSAVSFLSPAFN
jgi:MFS family permease